MLSNWTINDEDKAMELTKDTFDDHADWKIVGSLSRRQSLVHPPVPLGPHQHPLATENQWESLGGIQWEEYSIFKQDTCKPASTLHNKRHQSFSIEHTDGKNSFLSELGEAQYNVHSYFQPRSTIENPHSFNSMARRPSLGYIQPSLWDTSLKTPQRRMSQPLAVTDQSISKSHINLFGRIHSLSDIQEPSNANTIRIQTLPSHFLIFMIEFKSGRTDFYYLSDPFIVINRGDNVILEADRGEDLGKVATDSLSINQVLLLQQNGSDETNFKKIIRLAAANDINMLEIMRKDEQDALDLCLLKIADMKLPMEIVDAEFQWDRRKLTFYFIADKRIDFRNLVKELFKIYKTRIWMCAVSLGNKRFSSI